MNTGLIACVRRVKNLLFQKDLYRLKLESGTLTKFFCTERIRKRLNC